MTEVEFAYLAGIVDGEGHVERHRCALLICMADTQILDWCKEHFGGTLSGEYVPEGNSRPRRMWSLTRARGLAPVARGILPYLTLKRREVEIMLEIIALGPGPRGNQRFSDWAPAWHVERARLTEECYAAMLARKS